MISFEAQSYLKRYRQLILPTVTLVMVVGLTLAVVIPQTVQAVADWKSLQALKQQVGVLTEKATVLSNLDLNELTVRTREVVADIPNDEDLGYFVAGVRSIAEQSGTGFGQVDLVGVAQVEASATAETKTAAKKGEQVIPLKVGVSGSLSDAKEFLRVVNNSVPLVELLEFQYGRGLGEDNFGGSVTLNFFYLGVPTTIGAVDQPMPVITSAEEETYQALASYLEPKTMEVQTVQTGNKEFIR